VFAVESFDFTFLRFVLPFLVGEPFLLAIFGFQSGSGNGQQLGAGNIGGELAYSSAVMALYSIVSSRYSRRQAGHRPFRLVLMLLKQNWQICTVEAG
jgi:hypothetical protein